MKATHDNATQAIDERCNWNASCPTLYSFITNSLELLNESSHIWAADNKRTPTGWKIADDFASACRNIAKPKTMQIAVAWMKSKVVEPKNWSVPHGPSIKWKTYYWYVRF